MLVYGIPNPVIKVGGNSDKLRGEGCIQGSGPKKQNVCLPPTVPLALSNASNGLGPSKW